MEPYALGALPSPSDPRDFLASAFLSVTTYPAEVDWEPHLTPVKNQAAFGACVAHAGAGQKEFYDVQESPAGGDLSEQALYQWCKEIDGYPNVEGTTGRACMQVLQKRGIPEDKYWRYEARYPAQKSPLVGIEENARKYRTSSYAAVLLSPDAMRQALYMNGPVMIAVKVFDSFMATGTDGVVHAPSGSMRGYHMMLAAGYSLSHIKAKNSWGLGFGKAGYVLMPWEVWGSMGTEAWSIVDMSNVTQYFEDWPDQKTLLEQYTLFTRAVMVGDLRAGKRYFNPDASMTVRHVNLVSRNMGLPYNSEEFLNYDVALRSYVRDSIPGLDWFEERWNEPITRYQFGLLMARKLLRDPRGAWS
jgi:hypothetical protein